MGKNVVAAAETDFDAVCDESFQPSQHQDLKSFQRCIPLSVLASLSEDENEPVTKMSRFSQKYERKTGKGQHVLNTTLSRFDLHHSSKTFVLNHLQVS